MAGVRNYKVAVFLFCKQRIARKDFRLSNILVESLNRYMSMFTTGVGDEIKTMLLERLELIIDGCSGCSIHNISVFALFLVDLPDEIDSLLFAMALMEKK